MCFSTRFFLVICRLESLEDEVNLSRDCFLDFLFFYKRFIMNKVGNQ